MPDLIAPHGGLEQPLNLTVPADEIADFKANAAKLTKVPVSDADLSTVYRWGDGALSPTTGPMTESQFNRVLDESVFEYNGKLYAWTIPLSLPVTKELAGQLKAGQNVALTNSAGEIVATLAIGDIFEWDKPRYIKSVYLTDRTDHPGADMVLKGDADKTHLLGGLIRVLPQPKNAKFGKYVLSPREVRKLLGDQRLEPRRRVPDPQSAASGARIRAGVRSGTIAEARPQRRRGFESAHRRNQGRRRASRRPHAHLRSPDRPARLGRRRQRRRRSGVRARKACPIG